MSLHQYAEFTETTSPLVLSLNHENSHGFKRLGDLPGNNSLIVSQRQAFITYERGRLVTLTFVRKLHKLR